MAAGRHVSYFDEKLRDEESDVKSFKRKFAYSRGDSNQFRNGDLDCKRAVNDTRDRDRAMVGKRDTKERETLDSGYGFSSRSTSGGSGGGAGDCGPKRCGFSDKSLEREPGELSSESRSDDAIESESQVIVTEKVIKIGSSFPVEKKRKFSPIIWDRDDKQIVKFSKSRKSPEATSLPPPPPLIKACHQSLDLTYGGDSRSLHCKESKLRQDYITAKFPVSFQPASTTPIEFPSPSLLQRSISEQEIELHESKLVEDESSVTRHISSSRWAAKNNSPVDEGEILEEEETYKKRPKQPHGLLHNRFQNTRKTSELSELTREGSEGNRGRSSESDERGHCSRSRSEDGFSDYNAMKSDDMEVEEENGRGNVSGSQSDTDSDDGRSLHNTPGPAGPPQRSINMLQGCRNVNEFERLNKIDEGTYGVVFRAKDKKTGEVVALKKVKMEREREGFPLTSLREINILLSFNHPSVVDVKEVVVGSSLDSIFMVMEYMEHDLKALMETMKQPFSQSEVKCLMIQLLEGVKYLHGNWVLHRDLKTSNLLLNNRGELKICDFGLARQYGSPLKPYTQLVVTLWYRAPELLLGAKQYSTAIDMWSLGCIMAELLSKEPLFNGKTELEQLDKIFKTLGTPTESIWPGYSKLPGVKVNFVKHQYNQLRKKFPVTSFTGSPVLSEAGFDLLNKLLTFDPDKRITAEAALKHEWFFEVPLPKSKDFMPTFPAQHAQDRRLRRIMKSPDPLEELRKRELRQAELGTGGVFG